MEFFRWNIFKNETNRTSNCWLGSDQTAAADNKWNKLPARCKNSCRYLPVVTEEIRTAISHNLTLRPRNSCRGRTFCQTHVLASPNFEARFQAALQQSFCIVCENPRQWSFPHTLQLSQRCGMEFYTLHAVCSAGSLFKAWVLTRKRIS